MKFSLSNRVVLILLVFQFVTLQFWLTLSAHSGQTTIPWMMNEGRVLFGTILEQHAPATSLISAFANTLSPFDVGITARLLNTILMMLITLAVYRLASHYGKSTFAGIIAAGIWILLAPVFGNVLFYFNTLLVGCIVWALVTWISYEAQPVWWKLVLVGLLFGLSTLAKQQGWACVGVFGLWLLFTRRSFKETVLFGCSALLLPSLVIAIITMQGNLDNYIYWNWTFNFSGLMDSVPLESNFFRKLLIANAFVPAFFLIWFRSKQQHIWLLFLLYLTLLIPLYPRFGESAAVTHIPFVAIMSGIVIQHYLGNKPQIFLKTAENSDLIVLGLTMSIGLGWLWMGGVMYIRSDVLTPGYDEFAPIVDVLNEISTDGDTLFVFPETDSTPQLHPLSNMLPPQTWIKGWRWYLEAPTIVDILIAEWSESPPDFVVVFPELVVPSQPQIDPLLDILDNNYALIIELPNITLHGNVIIYRFDND